MTIPETVRTPEEVRDLWDGIAPVWRWNSITDSILVRLGPEWDGFRIYEDAKFIRLQPGIIGGCANRHLLPFNRKIGPDPASIDTAKIGGILANNASGMCCGTAQNSYNTVDSMRIVMGDGTRLDTGDPASRESFRQRRGPVLQRLDDFKLVLR